MKNDVYAKYYANNREILLGKMRERDAKRRAERKESYAENPDLIDEDRAKYRAKYYLHRTNQVRSVLESAPQTPLIASILADPSALQSLTPAMARNLKGIAELSRTPQQ